jgi:peptidoglycan-N-acetylglucosamine deacetylase
VQVFELEEPKRFRLSQTTMKVSVIVPAFNEEALIRQCLTALRNQDYQGDIEILVVDNNSTDRTAEIARSLGARVVREDKQGVVFALKRGTEETSGDILIFTDADTIVPSNWVSTIVAALEANPDAAAAGGWVAFYDSNWKGALFCKYILPIGMIYDRFFFSYAHLWGANMGVRREAFEKVGGWNTNFNLHADSELSKRLSRVGKVLRIPNFCVNTSARRWNTHCLVNIFIYALNFLSLQILNRPIFYNFPTVRIRLASARTAAGPHLIRWRMIYAAGLFSAFFGTILFFAIWPTSSAYGKVYWHFPTHDKVVALTFDDGPNEPATSAVLKILRENGIHATFFLVGANVEKYPGAAREIVKEGNAIGNHSYSHPWLLAVESAKERNRQIDLAEKIIEEATGVHCTLFRPPHGYKSPWLLQAVKNRGMLSIEWAEDSSDWMNEKSQKIAANVLKKVQPGDIVLLHDGKNLIHGADRRQTLQALPAIIEGLKSRGFHFVTIPELIGNSH